jgi:serine O-acetyltransferase
MPNPLTYVIEDVRTALEKDPAARSVPAVLTYPGLHAVWAYRVAHALWERGFCLPARALSQLARLLTGVEVHPGARLGRRVFIDHGMGVVVGETAVVGDDVHLFHGVTLGGDDPRPVKRHPTVGEGTTLGANATLVGDITVGPGATVGAGAVVVDDVPAGATVAGNPAEVVDAADEPVGTADEPERNPVPGTGAGEDGTGGVAGVEDAGAGGLASRARGLLPAC